MRWSLQLGGTNARAAVTSMRMHAWLPCCHAALLPCMTTFGTHASAHPSRSDFAPCALEAAIAHTHFTCMPSPPCFACQVVPLLEGPVGMALYEWQDGQLGPVSLQGGTATSRSTLSLRNVCHLAYPPWCLLAPYGSHACTRVSCMLTTVPRQVAVPAALQRPSVAAPFSNPQGPRARAAWTMRQALAVRRVAPL